MWIHGDSHHMLNHGLSWIAQYEVSLALIQGIYMSTGLIRTISRIKLRAMFTESSYKL